MASALVLLILAVGFCCLDDDPADSHGMSMGLCSAALLFAGFSALGELVRLGLVPLCGREVIAAVAPAIPKPPPRLIQLP
jgi:hypothetical protein